VKYLAKKVTKALITSFSKFKSAWEKDAGKPENTLMYYLMAALNLEKDKKLGDAMMTLVVSKRDCSEDAKSPSGLKLGRGSSYYVTKFLESPNSVRSYLGGSNENDYKINKKALTLTVTRQVDHGKGVKIFVHSGGRDMPVPAQFKKNSSGQWKLTEYSSFCMTVKKTKTEEGDF
jgi:hypothetical protein